MAGAGGTQGRERWCWTQGSARWRRQRRRRRRQESEPVSLVVDPEKPTVVSALAPPSFFVLRDHCGQGGEAAKAEGCQDQEWVLFVLSMDSWWQGGTQNGGRRDVSDGCVTPAHLKTPESEGLPPLPFWGRDPRR